MALDSAAGILYLTDFPEYPANYKQGWRAYDIETGSLLETRIGGGSEGAVKGIAVDESTHTVYTSNDDNSVERIEEWRPVVVPDVTTGKPTGNATLNGTVGLAGAGNVSECFFEYGPDVNNYTSTKPCNPAAPITEAKSVSAELTGLTDETTYHYRLVAANANGKSVGGDMTLTPHKVVALTTGPAEEVKRTSAKLTASYDGTGEATKYWFEWGVKPSALTSSSSEEEEGATNGATQISDVAEGLNPDTVYYYRVVAKNTQGESKGDILHFRTPPAVQSLETNPATNVKPRSAELNASYVGDGTHTTYFFEWGTHRIYGNSTPVEDAGSPTGPQNLPPASLTNLELETVYHYRVVATNTSGTTAGPDRSFKTTPAVGGIQLNATDVESHTATLTGQYVGDGQETSYYYEWGTNTAYLSGKSQTFNTGGPTGTTQLESLPISNLLGGTTYHFHIVATNATGTTRSPDTTFFTPTNVRALVTLPATEITQDSIALNAEFNGNGQDTHYYFEYGPTTAIRPQSAGAARHRRGFADRGDAHLDGDRRIQRVLDLPLPGGGVERRRLDEWERSHLPDAAGSSPRHPGYESKQSGPDGGDTGSRHKPGTLVDDLRVRIRPHHCLRAADRNQQPDRRRPHVPSGQQRDRWARTGHGLYHFRVVATNFTGTTHGPDQTFATPGPPKVDLASASDVAPSSAHLAALVDPKSSATTVRFDYGATTAYGASTAPIDVGSGNGDRQVDADIAGLATGHRLPLSRRRDERLRDGRKPRPDVHDRSGGIDSGRRQAKSSARRASSSARASA